METSDEISSASDPSFSLSPLDNLSHTVSIISGPVNIANRFVTNMAKDRNGGMGEGIHSWTGLHASADVDEQRRWKERKVECKFANRRVPPRSSRVDSSFEWSCNMHRLPLSFLRLSCLFVAATNSSFVYISYPLISISFSLSLFLFFNREFW